MTLAQHSSGRASFRKARWSALALLRGGGTNPPPYKECGPKSFICSRLWLLEAGGIEPTDKRPSRGRQRGMTHK